MLTVQEISELIADMVAEGAPKNEIQEVIRHSMDRLDLEREVHRCQLSAIKYGIEAYWRKYHLKETET